MKLSAIASCAATAVCAVLLLSYSVPPVQSINLPRHAQVISMSDLNVMVICTHRFFGLRLHRMWPSPFHASIHISVHVQGISTGAVAHWEKPWFYHDLEGPKFKASLQALHISECKDTYVYMATADLSNFLCVLQSCI
jgi:hypothetical protein